MANSNLLLTLIKAGISGDQAEVRESAEAIAAAERAKKHTGVADRIAKVLVKADSRNGGGALARGGTRSRDSFGGIQRREPTRALHTLLLDEHVHRECVDLIGEQNRADLLRAHGLEPRHRLLLVGPPGNGKTTLAEALAYEMALPLLNVRYEAVITSYLGETAQRLRRVFDYVRTEPCVLFFDEFDALGKERGDIHETGEIKRVVTTLLLQLDDLPSYCVLIGATNHPELLDRAAWRRFELRLELAAPTQELLEEFARDRLSVYSEKPGYSPKRLCDAVAPGSYAEFENFFLDVARHYVLSQGQRELRTVIDWRVRAWTSRKAGQKDDQDYERTTNPPAPY